MGIDQIASEILRLSPRDRATLAETLWESLEDPYAVATNMTEREAVKLAKQREREIQKEEVAPLSHEELMSSLRK